MNENVPFTHTWSQGNGDLLTDITLSANVCSFPGLAISRCSTIILIDPVRVWLVSVLKSSLS